MNNSILGNGNISKYINSITTGYIYHHHRKKEGKYIHSIMATMVLTRHKLVIYGKADHPKLKTSGHYKFIYRRAINLANDSEYMKQHVLCTGPADKTNIFLGSIITQACMLH